jgi:tetratricopeptide (TPR) repeat protein
MMGSAKRALLLLVGVAAVVVFTMAFRAGRDPGVRVFYTTLGEVQAVHAEVRVASRDVRGVKRFGAGDSIATGADGRARVRLDDGTTAVIDRSTSVVASRSGLAVGAGRVFVQGAARTEIIVDEVTVLVGTSTVAVDRTAGVELYCVAGEAVARAFAKEWRVHSGETARVAGREIVIAPEKAWNDWTGGMAHPWSVAGRPRAAIGELWGRLGGGADDAGTPLAVRAHDVSVTLVGEVATTETRTTYFNAGSAPVVGDFRMAVPVGAIVSGFAVGKGDALADGDVRLASETDGDTDAARLEWAGEGWLRGKVRPIAPGETAVVVVRYVEWLSPAGGRLTYRYPMIAERASPVIGEFHAHVDIGGVDASAVGVGPDMAVSRETIEMRRADFRPTADLVVDFQLRPGSMDAARGYLVPGPDDTGGSFLLVRSEAEPQRAPAGVTLALLVDTSRSIDPSSLEAERALVDALLDGLGPLDRVVVFAAADAGRPVGPGALGAVDDDRRTAIHQALAGLRPGGATDLGAALERAADALPADDVSATLMYVGDGWPTLGDADVEAIRTRLSRRPAGLPRLGAVTVGQVSNRLGLTALVRGAGPVFSVEDRDTAAEVAVHLLAQALQPAVAGAVLDLGPDTERIYPRGGRTLRVGDTLTTVGRLRVDAPRRVLLRYRDGREQRAETRALSLLPVVDDQDIRRRWADARVEELMLSGAGREAVVDAALRNGLLTPWTGWSVGVPAGATFRATPLWTRVLDSALQGSLAVFSAGFGTPRVVAGALTTPSDEPWPRPDAAGRAEAVKLAASGSVRRALDEATDSVRQCRESRAALRPEVGGALRVELSVGTDGRVRSLSVRGASSFDDDAALDRCVELVIQNLRFVSFVDVPAVTVSYEYRLAPPRESRARGCSRTSALPTAMRRGVWFERLHRPESEQNPRGSHGERAYFRAREACELPAWADRRTFLELLLDQFPDGTARVELARALDEGGDTDAGALIRREAARRAQTPAELDAVRRALLVNEPDVALPFVTAYARAGDDSARLRVVETFLRMAPHDPRLRRRELALLEALGRKDDVLAESEAVRQEPFLNASLLADTASALRRVGAPEAARLTFGELAERAPGIPFARALLGDRFLDEGWNDEATVAYEALLRLVPDDPAASFRLALAHAGAGRLDIALRMLSRVATTGGRTSDPVLAEVASVTSAVLVAEARARFTAPEADDGLRRRAAEISVADGAGFVLIRAPTWVPGLDVTMVRGVGGEGGDTAPPLRVPSVGFVAVRLDRGEGIVRLRVKRQADLAPSRPATARVQVLATDGHGDAPRLVSMDAPLRVDGEVTELVWDGAALR